jgi:hypothetical protein
MVNRVTITEEEKLQLILEGYCPECLAAPEETHQPYCEKYSEKDLHRMVDNAIHQMMADRQEELHDQIRQQSRHAIQRILKDNK